jgi:hypothetical protein
MVMEKLGESEKHPVNKNGLCALEKKESKCIFRWESYLWVFCLE